jgi:peptidoglycan/xylan/chitin deacetylase (PgdA/CDA1 family)
MKTETVSKVIFGIGLLVIAVVIILLITQTFTDVYTTTYDNIISKEEFILSNNNFVTTLSNLPSNTLTATHKNQTWLDFNGTNQIIYSTVIPELGINQNFTIFAKYKTDNITILQQLINNANADANRFGCNLAMGELKCSTYNGSDYLSSSSNLGSNNTNWNNMVYSTNSTDGNVYVNGVYPFSNHQPALSSTLGFFFGARYNINYLNGSLDNIIIYNDSLNRNIEYLELAKQEDNNYYVPFLMLHTLVQPPSEPNDAYEINESDLRDLMGLLQYLNYSSINLTQYYNWTKGLVTIPERSIIFIFDDGDNTNLISASIMAEYGFKGVSAIVSNFTNTGSYMSWENISMLVNNYGWEIVSHSNSHCNHITKCNSTIDWGNEMSMSKSSIYGNLSVSPVAYIYPQNSWNATSQSYCDDYYLICFGNAYNTDAPRFNVLNTNLTNGLISRINIGNASFLTDFNEAFNYTLGIDDNIILNYKLNENLGTITYDNSISSRNGTISNATWNNDGVNILLVEGTDYSISTKYFTLLNSDLSWMGINTTYGYFTTSGGVTIATINSDFSSGIDNISEKIPTILLIFGVVILFGALVLLVRNAQAMGVGGGGSL